MRRSIVLFSLIVTCVFALSCDGNGRSGDGTPQGDVTPPAGTDIDAGGGTDTGGNVVVPLCSSSKDCKKGEVCSSGKCNPLGTVVIPIPPPVTPKDTDSDGVDDSADNCVAVANPDQKDMDKDKKGDLCDEDKDGDGFGNDKDNCPTVYNPDQTDKNGNGVGSACETPSDAALPSLTLTCPPPAVAPSEFITDKNPKVTIAVEADVKLVCTLDGSPVNCSAGEVSLTADKDGDHNFHVAAYDKEEDMSEASCSWVLDATPPLVEPDKVVVSGLWRGFNVDLPEGREIDPNFIYYILEYKCFNDLSCGALLAEGRQIKIQNSPDTPVYNSMKYDVMVWAVDKAGNASQIIVKSVTPAANIQKFISYVPKAALQQVWRNVSGYYEKGANKLNVVLQEDDTTERYIFKYFPVDMLLRKTTTDPVVMDIPSPGANELGTQFSSDPQLDKNFKYHYNFSLVQDQDPVSDYLFQMGYVSADKFVLNVRSGDTLHSKIVENDISKYDPFNVTIASAGNITAAVFQNNWTVGFQNNMDFGLYISAYGDDWSTPMKLASVAPTCTAQPSMSIKKLPSFDGSNNFEVYITYRDYGSGNTNCYGNPDSMAKLLVCKSSQECFYDLTKWSQVDLSPHDSVSQYGGWSQILFDNQGCRHVFYHDNKKKAIYHMTDRAKDGTGCMNVRQTPEKIVQSSAWGPMKAVADPSGYIHLIWSCSKGGQYCQDANGVAHTLVAPNGGRFTSLFADTGDFVVDGYPYIFESSGGETWGCFTKYYSTLAQSRGLECFADVDPQAITLVK